MKKYILIAGVNGAGKSTLYHTINSLQDMLRVNTDEIIRTFGNWQNASDNLKAGKIAVKKIKEYFENGYSFNQETTLCGKSIFRNIKFAKEQGYYIEMHYVGVDSVELAKERVAYRVQHGGHGISDADIERRYLESLDNLQLVLPMCDFAVLYDNTINFHRFAIYESGKLIKKSEIQPKWYASIGDISNEMEVSEIGNL
jgi:predicted ABC-type ATPase